MKNYRRTVRTLRAIGPAQFPLPTSTLAGYALGCAGCGRCPRRSRCRAALRGLRGLGANVVTVKSPAGQVLTFDLDDPAQKAQYEALKSLWGIGRTPEPTTTVLLPTTLQTPQLSPNVFAYLQQTQPTIVPGAPQPWLDQELIPGVKNMWLAGGTLGLVLLISMRKGGRR